MARPRLMRSWSVREQDSVVDVGLLQQTAQAGLGDAQIPAI